MNRMGGWFSSNPAPFATSADDPPMYEAELIWSDPEASTVIVTGDFDNWKRSVKCVKTESGMFVGKVSIPYGKKVFYKFFVNGNWAVDPHFPREADAQGNENNFIEAPTTPVPVGSKPNSNSSSKPGSGFRQPAPQIPRTIYFYNKSAPYYGFTNFSSHPVMYENKSYPTSEHLFQALKFLERRPGLAEHIRTQPNPRQAFQEAQRFGAERREDWQDISIQMMEIAIGLKFRQHHDLKKELLSTGDAELVEDAGVNDAFWGNGADGKGRNELGKALVRLRDELRREAEPKK